MDVEIGGRMDLENISRFPEIKEYSLTTN